MSKNKEEKILNSWRKNVTQWTQAIKNGEIASREQITNQAILDAMFAAEVRSLIDIGCGEGWLIIQTLHPQFIDSNDPYESGWRTGSSAGFSDSFVDPPPWYFRTVDDWLGLFEQYQFEVGSILEPRAEPSSDPVSIIFNLNTCPH